jgi:hypothetical protein
MPTSGHGFDPAEPQLSLWEVPDPADAAPSDPADQISELVNDIAVADGDADLGELVADAADGLDVESEGPADPSQPSSGPAAAAESHPSPLGPGSGATEAVEPPRSPAKPPLRRVAGRRGLRLGLGLGARPAPGRGVAPPPARNGSRGPLTLARGNLQILEVLARLNPDDQRWCAELSSRVVPSPAGHVEESCASSAWYRRRSHFRLPWRTRAQPAASAVIGSPIPSLLQDRVPVTPTTSCQAPPRRPSVL